MRRIVGRIAASLLLLGILVAAIVGFEAATKAQHENIALAKMFDADALAHYRLKELAEKISFGLVKNEAKARLQKLRNLQESDEHRSRVYAAIAWGVMLLGLLVALLFLPKEEALAWMSLAALVMLSTGIAAPLLSVTIHKEIAYLGDVVLSFESKSLLGSVKALFAKGEWAVGGVIALFSLLLPYVKLLFFLVVALGHRHAFVAKAEQFLRRLGKWSMLDVFVVAIVVSYLGSADAQTSRATLHIGIFFFLAYVLLSLVASLYAERLVRR